MKFSRLLRMAVVSLAVIATASVALAQDRRAPLRILVYGATGEVGTHIVDEALARGHIVTAVSRDPARITKDHPNLSAVAGDLLDRDSVANLVADRDVVIISVRGIIGENKPENALQYLAVKNVVQQLCGIGAGAARLIHVGGSGSLEVKPGVLYADTIPKLFIPKSLEAEIQGQIIALDYLRTVTGVEWTYATPPRNFTNGPRTGDFRVGGDTVLEDRRGRSRISRADFAVAVLDEAELERHTGRRFSVAY